MTQSDQAVETELGKPVGKMGIVILLLYTVTVFILAAAFVAYAWASPDSAAGDYPAMLQELDDRLMLIATASGVIGAFIHAATSLITYIGNRELLRSWAAWYLLRPFIGGALGFLSYFVIRAGLITANNNADAINPYGIVALAGLFGMFSRQAVDKLQEVFDALLARRQEPHRADRMGYRSGGSRQEGQGKGGSTE